MIKPLLIIVSGLPCAGKTTLGKRIATTLGLPFIHRDGIKELLFDTLGWKDREWSKLLGRASYELLWHFAEIQLAAGYPLIIESNFDPKFATTRLLTFKDKFDFEPLQVFCKASGEVLVQRYKRRVESGQRHPGHVDHLNYEEAEATLRQGELDALDIGGQVIEVDTTNVEQIDYDGLCATIRPLLVYHSGG